MRAWNIFFGSSWIWLAFQANAQTIEDKCHDGAKTYPPSEVISACSDVIDKGGRDDEAMATLIAARASAYFEIDDYSRAIADYREAIRLDPDEAAWPFNLGLLHYQTDDWPAAITDFSTAIRLAPTDPDGYSRRGLVFLDSQKFEQAIADYTEVIRLRPENATALAYRGIAHMSKSDERRAVQDFAAARAIDPSNRILQRGEGLLDMNRGNMKGAVQRFTALLDQYPADKGALILRAAAYKELGEHQKMEADIDALKEIESASSKGAP